MRSSNPILTREGAFGRGAPPTADQLSRMYNAPSYTPPVAEQMTIDDVVLRTAATLGTVLVVGAASWALDLGIGFAVLGAIAGLVLAMVNIFKRKVSPPLILAYAACEGLFLGVISHYFNTAFSSGNPLVGSIVTQAVIGTTLAFVGVLAAYSLRIVRVTQKFTRYVVGAGIALLGLMIVNLLAGMFIPGGLGLRTGGTASIIFSVIAIAVGCLFLLLDFNEIEQGVRMGAPKSQAWMSAFGLTVTLIWIYLEILRLLSYFRQ